MMTSGYTLIKLILSGQNVPNAEVEFSKGLNVISGASDTGKTFILECIYYVLGGSDLPEAIPEARKYSLITLVIQDNTNGDYISLDRNLHKVSDVALVINGTEEIVLKHEASNDDSSLSGFLFNRLGLLSKELITNRNNKTRTLYFKDLARLSIIKEDKVFSKTSPILTGQYVHRTTETSVFKFVLTGQDDSNLIEAEEPKVSKARKEGKKEIILEIIGRLQDSILSRKYKIDLEQLYVDLENNENRFEELNSILLNYKNDIDELEKSRKEVLEYTHVIELKIDSLDELLNRFELLDEQYASDIQRLSSISETSRSMILLKKEVKCPLCGTDAKDIESFDTNYESINLSCSSEIVGINKLKDELASTCADLNKDKDELQQELLINKSKLNIIQSSINDKLKPLIMKIIDEMQMLNKHRLDINANIEFVKQIENYSNLLGELETNKGNTVQPSNKQHLDNHDYELLNKLCKYIEDRLKSWNYPDLDRVTFSYELADIVVSGRSRKSHGKGVRAIYHAAFTTGLYKYCQDNNMPHVGFVLIDSPLVVYQAPDTGEENFDYAVKDSFYRDLANVFSSGQIIIIENDEPPSDLSLINHIVFTKDKSFGRYGFLPSLS